MRDEFVGERLARLDRILGDMDTVHGVGEALTVEMDTCRLVHVVLERRPDACRPRSTVSRGPGHVPLNPSPAMGSFLASIWCWISSIVMSKTFTPSTILGSRGTLPGFAIDAPSPPRKRSTTASAFAS